MIERMPLRMAPPLTNLTRALSHHSRPRNLLSAIRQRPIQPRYQQSFHSRLYATTQAPLPPPPPPSTSQQTTENAPPPPQDPIQPNLFQQPPPPPPRPKRSLRPFILATICFLIGATAGQYVRLVISPPALPLPGTPEDEALTGYIASRAAQLPIVQSLTIDPSFTSWPAYSTFSADEAPHRLTSGPLGGSRALGGYQQIFYNKDTGEFISVLWIGGALAGWPGVCHGGLLATVLDESMGRCAIQRFPEKTGVTANLDITYLRPTVTNTFAVVRCLPIEEGSKASKQFVEGRVEMLDGTICVEAKALFVAPKSLKLRNFKTVKEGEGF